QLRQALASAAGLCGGDCLAPASCQGAECIAPRGVRSPASGHRSGATQARAGSVYRAGRRCSGGGCGADWLCRVDCAAP
nr:hypothetical protein [Tanacetum cinerariifolium]